MKFNEMTYTRPDIGALLARCKELAAKAAAAPDGDALVRLYYEQSEAFAEYNTAANLANIHYTCDTRDEYWKAEQDFFDANGPAVTNASVEISRSFLANPHVDALTEKFGTTCVAGMKNAVLGMDDRTVELQQQFNALVSRYQQIYGGALVELDGKQLTIPQLGPYKEDLDPAVRRAAYEAEAGYFDAHRAELDELYGEIVKNLNAQARVMGYHDYSELSYVRMNRIGYGPEEIRKFRDQVANDVVPQLQKVMALRAKRTGIARPTFTDLPIMFKDGNPKPIPGYKARMDAARTMYHELSPETAEFIDFMQDNELFDVESRPGKMSGGYMTSLPSYKAPFIFANWNGTSADVEITGRSVHPGSAKNKMINASRVAMEFASLLPSREVPENTEGYEGFAHLNNMEGDVEHAHLHYIIRDHDRDLLEARKDKFNLAAEFINRKYGLELVKVTLKDAYSNMKEMILPHQEILDVARAAMRKNGVEPVTTPIRGGTDGARLSFMGLPCPNLCTGGELAHGRNEFAVLEEMETIVEIVKSIAELVE